MASNLKILVALILSSATQLASAQDVGLSKQFSGCMDKSNGVTVEMLECIDAEIKRQDRRLNKAYKDVMDQLSPERKKQLQHAQRAWINYRDANCKFYDDPDGGSLARVSAADCLMSETASRAKEIESFAGVDSTPSAAKTSEPPAQAARPASNDSVAQNVPPVLTGLQKNALRAAQSYLSISAFSRDGLIEQLSSSAGSGFNIADATIAVDSMNIDWNQEAVKSAKQYLQMMGFSCKGLIQQLSSRAGGKFTEQQAAFGAKQAGAC